MSNITKQQIVDSELYKYEELIIEFIIDKSQFEQKKTDIQQHILTYLFIHEKLTQQEIKDLSELFYKKGNKSGFSSGSISSYLNELVDLSITRQKKIETKQVSISPRSVSKFYLWQTSNLYFLNPRFLNIRVIFSPEIGEEKMRKAISFFTEKIINLNMIRARSTYKNKVKNILLERIREMIECLDYYSKKYKEFMSKFPIKKNKEYLAIENHRNNIVKLLQVDENEPQVVEDDNLSLTYPNRKQIEEIENDLIEFTTNSHIFDIQSHQFSVIAAYLIFRKELTQQEIKELTGYSTGIISQGLNYLIKQGLIRKKKIIGIRQKLYVLDSIAYYNFSRIYKKLEIVTKWAPIINEALNELKNRENEIVSKNGYIKIKRCLEYLNQTISANQYFFEEISNERIKFKPIFAS